MDTTQLVPNMIPPRKRENPFPEDGKIRGRKVSQN